MPVRPIKNRVFVALVEEDKVTASGIVLVDSANTGDGLVHAKVVAAGPGAWVKGERQPMSVAVGDTVVIPRYSGTEVTVDGEELIVLFDTDIAAVVG